MDVSSKDHIHYLDGLKGISVIIVLFSHLAFGFYPYLHTTDPNVLGNENIIIKTFASTPLGIIYSGSFAVMIFYFLTGYILTYRYFTNKHTNYMTSVAFRRYFRLTTPILFSCIIAWLLLTFNLFCNTETSKIVNSQWLNYFYRFEPNFLKMLKFSLYDVYFQFSFPTSYNNVLWIMEYELFGSFLILSSLAIFGKTSRRVILYFVLIIVLCKTYYLAFILGMLLCDHNLKSPSMGKMQDSIAWKIILCSLFIAGIYLGSYKTHLFMSYKILNIGFLINQFGDFHKSFYNIMGVFLLLISLTRSNLLKIVFSGRIVRFLGKISFSIYLIHLLVICSLSSYVFNYMFQKCGSFSIALMTTLVTTIISVIMLSFLFYKYVEVKCIRLSEFLYGLYKD